MAMIQQFLTIANRQMGDLEMLYRVFDKKANDGKEFLDNDSANGVYRRLAEMNSSLDVHLADSAGELHRSSGRRRPTDGLSFIFHPHKPSIPAEQDLDSPSPAEQDSSRPPCGVTKNTEEFYTPEYSLLEYLATTSSNEGAPVLLRSHCDQDSDETTVPCGFLTYDTDGKLSTTTKKRYGSRFRFEKQPNGSWYVKAVDGTHIGASLTFRHNQKAFMRSPQEAEKKYCHGASLTQVRLLWQSSIEVEVTCALRSYITNT